MKKLYLLILICLSGSVLAKDDGVWIGTWAMNPTGLPNVAKLGSFTLPEPTTVKGTVRYRLRISQGGTQIRLRFSNEYSDKPLTITSPTRCTTGQALPRSTTPHQIRGSARSRSQPSVRSQTA